MSTFDEVLEAVTEGDEYTVTRDGKDVAVILPVGEYEEIVEAIDDSEPGEAETP